MVEAKAKTFTEFLNDSLKECMWERVGQLYHELEKLEEHKELSAKEDEFYGKLNASLPKELHETLFDYNSTVEQKFAKYRDFYYRMGFKDFLNTTKNEEQPKSFIDLSDELVTERLKHLFGKLEKQEKFEQLSEEEDKLRSKLKAETPAGLLETLFEYGNVIQRKYAQYQQFYYKMGYLDCEEYLSRPIDDDLWGIGKEG